jgi:hypothetical protein
VISETLVQSCIDFCFSTCKHSRFKSSQRIANRYYGRQIASVSNLTKYHIKDASQEDKKQRARFCRPGPQSVWLRRRLDFQAASTALVLESQAHVNQALELQAIVEGERQQTKLHAAMTMDEKAA